MTSNSSEPNPKLSQALRSAIDHLRQEHARPGSKEGGYLLNEETGAVLEYVVGTEDSVEFDEAILNHCRRGCVLHSHPADSPANQYDWQWFMENPNVRRMIVVGPTHTYFIVKPIDWHAAKDQQRSAFEKWEDNAVDVVFERGFSVESPPTARQWQEVEEEVNRRMVDHFKLEFVVEASHEIQ